MSLQVWIPFNNLNGNIRNQGISDINIINNGATVDTNGNGKIGYCYYFNGSSSISLQNLNFINTSSQFSIALWVKTTTPAATQCLLNYRTAVGEDIALFMINNYYRLDIGGTLCSFNSAATTSNWTHVVCTFDNKTAKIYLNGNFVQTKTATRSTISTSATTGTIGLSSTNNSPGSGNAFTGYINDYRIYNHCLSPKEVKELAQGLMLHYKFNSKGVNKNLVSKTYDVNGEIVGTREYINLFSTLSIYETYGLVPYTVSFDLRSEVPHSFNIYGNYGSNPKYVFTNIHINVTTEWQHFSYTFTPYLNGDGTGTWAGVSIYGTYDSGAIPHIKNIKFELGEFETPLSPVDISMVYDMSGYSHHHQPSGSFTLSSDTPRYDKSLVFNGTNTYINLGRDLMVKDALTVTTWAYMSSWTSFAKIASCTEAGGWNFEKNGSNLNFAVGVGTTSNTYMGGGAFPLSQISSGWHMITGTFDGITKCLYIDGQLKSSGTVASKTPIFYNSKNNIFIGAEATGGANPTTPYFNGKMSDFRMYATALSAEDVLELYHTSVSIDDLGQTHAFEYTDIDSTVPSITKQGYAKANTLVEYNSKIKTLPDGSLWFLLMHHNAPATNLFTTETCWSSNTENLYSCIGVLKHNGFQQVNGKYEFLVCEKLESTSAEQQFRWSQTSNPATTSTVTGYSLISQTTNPSRSFGLKTTNTYGCFHNGSTWWCCCGSYTVYQGGIPGFGGIVKTGYTDLYIRLPESFVCYQDNDDIEKFYDEAILTNEFIEI